MIKNNTCHDHEKNMLNKVRIIQQNANEKFYTVGEKTNVQVRILKRGLEMLEVGGRLVYSTCSLNPIENEAVIHRLLKECEGCIRTVNVSSELPGLNFSQGLTRWFPASKDMQFYEKYEDVPDKWQTVIRPQMFPPNLEDSGKFHLDNCIRILPHKQDSGGFFVTVLEKLMPLPWETQIQTNVQENIISDEVNNKLDTQPVRKSKVKKMKMTGYKEDPFVFFNGNEDVWTSIKEFYEVETNSFLPQCLFTRCKEGKKKVIYFGTPLVKNFINANQEHIKIINSGVKVFVRCDERAKACAFRMAQEGLMSIYSFYGKKRLIDICREDFIKILFHNDPATPLKIEELSEEIQSRVKDFTTGSCLLHLVNDKFPLFVVGWRGSCSLRAYIPVTDSVHYLRILGEDVSRYDVNKFEKKNLLQSVNTEENSGCNEKLT